MAKQIPSGPNNLHITLDNALKLSKPLRDLYEGDERIRELIDTAKAIEGMPRHASTHAAGVVITKNPVADYVPLAKNDESVVTQYTMVTLEELGLLKMDFLGLRNLTVLDDAVQMVRMKHPGFTLSDIPDDDKETFEMLAAGKTSGVFQLESAGMTGVCVGLKPQSIEDITAIIALYRPGPMDSIPRFIACKHEPEKIRYKHPMLEPILSMTYGCIVYQEQVIEIFRKLAGFSLGQADMVRRAMSKKKMKDMVAYQTAYFKRHFTREYMAALLTSVLDSQEKVAEYIAECRDNGIRLLPPDVNESRATFTVSGSGDIRFGLVAIKGVGWGVIENLLKEREKNGPFTSFEDFCERLFDADLNRRVAESLIRSGCFDSLGYRRAQLMAVFGQILDGIAQTRKKNLEGQFDLFGGGGEEIAAVGKIPLPDLPEYSSRELMRMEKETTGLYFSGHPMDEYREVVRRHRAVPIGSILADFERADGPETYADEQRVTLAGVISAAKTKTTKNNSLMSYITLEDETGSMELLAFARVLNESGSYVQENMPVLVTGKISVRDEKPPQMMVDRLQPLDHLKEEREETASPAGVQPGKERKLYVKVPSESHPIWGKLTILFSMFPGRDAAVVVFADTRRKLGTRCVVHPALVSQLQEWLGQENVVVK